MQMCEHGEEAPALVIAGLESDQGGIGRHKCVICAYHQGLEDGRAGSTTIPAELESCKHGSTAPRKTLLALPDSQAGPGRHKCAICAYYQGYEAGKTEHASASSLETELLTHGAALEAYIPDEEGRKRLALHTEYERSAKNRAKAIEIHGTVCKACEFDFNAVYGADFAQNYIEIHHVESIAQLGGQQVDPHTDLVPLCSNCHSMAHRQRGRTLTVAELQQLIATQEGNNQAA